MEHITLKRIVFACIFCISAGALAQSTDRQQAVDLTNRAVELVNASLGANQAIWQAIRMLDSAIQVDSLYPQAYWSKGKFLCELGRRKSALETFDKLASLFPNTLGYWSQGGYILERMGKRKEATKRYLREIALCDSIISKFPDSLNIEALAYRAFLTMFTNGKSAGVAECEKLLNAHPDNQFLKGQLWVFTNFNRRQFITDACH